MRQEMEQILEQLNSGTPFEELASRERRRSGLFRTRQNDAGV
ncbi:MAG: hypothetical protein ACYSSK_06510 [Planctomycetota bacterium]